MLPTVDWAPVEPWPVIALLDTGVQPHAWLPAGVPPFCRTVEFPHAVDIPEWVLSGKRDVDFGSHWGHGTFIAGLIRQHALAAQVLSSRVMDDNGKANELNIIRALEHLAGMVHDGQRIDVVLMAFGRPRNVGQDDDSDSAGMRDAIAVLAGRGVTFVASAGNDGTTHVTDPAGLADDPHLCVVSVGAGTSEEDRECYSNHGPWVKQWRSGLAVSTMPLRSDPYDKVNDGGTYARWSGTSFAVPQLAAEVVQRAVTRRRSATAEP